jgi:hypothetical protein
MKVSKLLLDLYIDDNDRALLKFMIFHQVTPLNVTNFELNFFLKTLARKEPINLTNLNLMEMSILFASERIFRLMLLFEPNVQVQNIQNLYRIMMVGGNLHIFRYFEDHFQCFRQYFFNRDWEHIEVVFGHLEIIQYFSTKGIKTYEYWSSYLDNAIAFGHLEIVKFFFPNIYDNSDFYSYRRPIGLEEAILSGNIEIVNYYKDITNFEKFEMYFAQKLFDFGIKSGSLQIVRYLNETFYHFDLISFDIIFKAAEFGHLNILKWFLSNYRQLIDFENEAFFIKIFFVALEQNHFRIIKYLFAHYVHNIEKDVIIKLKEFHLRFYCYDSNNQIKDLPFFQNPNTQIIKFLIEKFPTFYSFHDNYTKDFLIQVFLKSLFYQLC